MYRVCLFFVLLAYCSTAPFDWKSQGTSQDLPVQQQNQFGRQPISFGQQQQMKQQDDVVDNSGTGYSYFKDQPIDSRPLAQQQWTSVNQRILQADQDQLSDYSKASAFPQQQLSVPQEQQSFVQPQQKLFKWQDQPQMTDWSKTKSFTQQQFPVQQQQQFPVQQQQFPVQQQQQQFPVQQQQFPVQQHKVNTVSGLSFQPMDLDNDDQPADKQWSNVRPTTFGNQQQQNVRFPSTVGIVSQQQPKQLWSDQQQGDFGSSFGQGQQQQQQPFIQPQQPLPRIINTQRVNNPTQDDTFDNSYGQQQQKLIRPTVFSVKSPSTYGQQQPQPVFNDQISGGGYGQQVQQPTRQTFPVNIQQSFVDQSGYGSQQQPKQTWSNQQSRFVSSVVQGQQQPLTSSFTVQSHQQNDLPPVITAFTSSNFPSQSQNSFAQRLPQQDQGSAGSW